VKRTLPTLPGNAPARPGRELGHTRGRGRVRGGADHPIAPQERAELPGRVIAVAHHNQPAAASQLAVRLCAAFVRDGVAVSALVTIDNSASAPEAQAALSGMIEAGARHAIMVRRPDSDVAGAVTRAIEQMAGAPFIVAFGNMLPQLFKPYFTVMVTGHRRTLAAADPLVLQADIEVTAPSDELATLLAKRIQTLSVQPA
jgi:hypothetical protein